MEQERWRKVEALFQAALERAPAERAAFLERECGGDAALRKEVDSLLQASTDTRFLETPAIISDTSATLTQPPRADSELLERLQRAVGSLYRVERELGGGGMARIFVATDTTLGRQVVLKVLAPELAAGIDAERFHREVRLAASLQHPHVVPLHAAGQADGLLYYTMPFVAGESLRQRLDREGPLPIPDVVRLLREVADALGFAHRRGIIHRDLKPANILLGEGHALVADFGIAKALVAATSTTTTTEAASTGESLTTTGLVLGTPVYMAPEQAVSDQAMDHRADLYALGCLAYELLTGRPPFLAPSVRALMTAHLIEPPTPVSAHRPEVPAALDRLVLRLLAKDPAQRPQSAAQVLESLGDSAMTAAPAPPSPLPGRRLPRLRVSRRALLVLAATMGVVAAGAVTIKLLRPATPTLLSTGVLKERGQLLIADFDARAGDSVLAPAVTEAFRIDLTGSPVITVMPSAKVSEALERMRRPPGTRLDATLAREMAVREGIKAVLTGQIARLGSGFLVSAQLVSPASGDVLGGYRETAADSTQVIAAIDRLSARLRGRIGESLRSVRSEPPLTQLTTSSLPALHKYIEGQVAGDVHNDHVRAVPLLEEAVALDSNFATAWRTLGGFQAILGNRTAAVAALTKALQHEDRLTELEREHTRAIYYSYITGEYDRAAAIYRDISQRYPQDSLAANNLAVAYYVLHQYERAESIWRVRLDTIHPWTPGVPLNLVNGLAALGKLSEAQRLVDKTLTLFQPEGSLLWYKARMAVLHDDYAAARSIAKEIKDHYALDPVARANASRDLASIALVSGQLHEAEEQTRDAMMSSADAGRPADYLRDAVELAFIETWFRRQPGRGIKTVEAALARFPLHSIPLLERPYLTLALAYATAGRTDRARVLLAEFERGVDPKLRRVDEYMRRYAWGQVALAEGRYHDAIAQLEAYVPTPRNCLACGQGALALAYDRAGNLDSAIAVYERFLTTPNINRLNEQGPFGSDETQLAPVCKRLGEIYEQRGDRVKAREHYSRFVKLWRDADPELRPSVLAVQQRLRQLGGDNPD